MDRNISFKEKNKTSESREFFVTICGVWFLGRLQDVIWKETVQNCSVCLSEFIQCDQVTSLNKQASCPDEALSLSGAQGC